ncbi:hypothetical protein WJX73_009404 [Symbiochloris irregularis]|uniref:Methyltransferase domain-containing protein n=1 Tax=Symbiochloris irregularis TaxID=706552 RepID=A0AAW1PF73_9CHLO
MLSKGAFSDRARCSLGCEGGGQRALAMFLRCSQSQAARATSPHRPPFERPRSTFGKAAVFSSRDFAEEVEFLTWAYQQHCKRKPASFLDLCCGPAEHARLLSQEGAQCSALDSSAAMLSYAKSKAKGSGKKTAINFMQGNMTSFKLEEKADLIGLLHGSVAELHTHEAALSCLRCICQALSREGLLVLEMLHPKEIFTGTFFEPLEWDFEFEGQDWTMCYGREGDLLNPFSQIVHKSIQVLRYSDEAPNS